MQNHRSMISFSVAIDEHDSSCWSGDGPADGEDGDPLLCPSSIQQVTGGTHNGLWEFCRWVSPCIFLLDSSDSAAF